jgi:glycerol-3-phosphate dehydrogenase
VLTRRTHIAIEAEDHGLTACAEVASLMGPELGWDETRMAEEIRHSRARAVAELAAQQLPDSASAMQVRNEVRDLRLAVADDQDRAEPLS